MKKGVILLLVLSLFAIFLSANFISAITCSVKTSCASGETRVMGLSAATNAHGQLATQSGYAYSLCCTGTDTTTCSGTNKILGLSSATNAHAESPDGTVYITNNVCYESLECNLYNNACPSTDPTDYSVQVLSLSATTNAHLGAFADYNTKICCKDNSPFVGGNCDLTDATWQVPGITPGIPVNMNVTGTNCFNNGVGTSVNFTVKKYGVLGIPFIVTTVQGNYPTKSWAPQDTGTYFFEATATASVPVDTFSSRNGNLFDELSVSASNPGDCQESDIGVCGDYASCTTYPDLQCNSDVYNVAQNDPMANPNPPAGYSYGCSWDTENNTCNFKEYYGNSEIILCGNGYTLCKTSTSDYYCYPGSNCPSAETPLGDGDELCDLPSTEFQEGCTSSMDCKDGDQDSCITGTTCSGKKCYSTDPVQEATACGSGFNLCYNPSLGLKYCYPKNTCPAGDQDIANVCIPPAEDSGGICVDSSEFVGSCVFSYISSEDNCDDGFLTYSWTVTVEGTGTVPSSCTDGSATIECPAQIPLPLFTPVNAVMTVFAIVAIYLVIAFMKNQKKKVSRKKRI